VCASIAIIQVQEIVKIADCEMGIKLLPLAGREGVLFNNHVTEAKKLSYFLMDTIHTLIIPEVYI